jgi:tetratricopeptide (TPR) repeat protein
MSRKRFSNRKRTTRLSPSLSLITLICLLAFVTTSLFAADTNSASTAATDTTNSQDTLRAYLQLQEQLHATQLAIERNRQEADAASAHNAEALTARLEAVEQALTAARSRDMEALHETNTSIQKSNQVMLTVAGIFAAIGFIAMFLTAYFQWRTIHRLAEISAAIPAQQPAAPVSANLLAAGERNQLTAGSAESTNVRLLGALDRLEKRILELEHTAQPALQPAPPSAGTSTPAAPVAAQVPQGNGQAPEDNELQLPSGNSARITLMLGKGQVLLDLNNAEEALACFNEVLTLNSTHTEALVKKGTALEKLEKLDEAVECYDRAIAADSSMTIAYLYKGGLFNRMERFNEALECYEQALRTQERRQS